MIPKLILCVKKSLKISKGY